MTQKLDGFHLKMIAIVAMLANHIGSVFYLSESYPVIFWLTETIGKLTFPIMAYLLVESFHYTRDRTKYAVRLGVFWLLSIIPFHIAFSDNWQFSPLDLVNNVLFTLLMGLIMMICYEKTTNIVLHVLIVIGFMLATILSDWNLFGILIIFGYYRISDPKLKIILPPSYVALPIFGLVLLAKSLVPDGPTNTIVEGSTMLGLLLTIPVLFQYNGQRGYSPKWVKWGYYAFYPVHLFVLYLIRWGMGM